MKKIQENFKKDILAYNIKKKKKQENLKRDYQKAIKWKRNKAKERNQLDKQWDEKYLENLYKESQGSILDYFFLSREQRGYECPIMRQKNTDLKTSSYNSFDNGREYRTKYRGFQKSYL